MTALARYAVRNENTRGRHHDETRAAGRPPFALDRHRILHCTAFRRLEHKTQVFVTHEGDHYRTRLTHSLEVAAQARRLADELNLNAAQAEAIALAHDLGHPPFGHAGEAALAARMRDHGGFEHNLQSLRVVEYLEHPYPEFRGLNLSYEVREGLVKHRTTFDRPPRDADDGAIAAWFDTGPHPSLEAQIVNLADEIAYALHDVEDGLMHELIDEAALNASRLWRDAVGPLRQRFPDRHHGAIRRPALDALCDRLIADAAAATRARLDAAQPENVDVVRRHASPLARFSPEVRAAMDELLAILKKTLYTHEHVRRMDREAERIIAAVFDGYVASPSRLPERFAARIAKQGLHRVVCDYVAGMTDRFCRHEFEKLTPT